MSKILNRSSTDGAKFSGSSRQMADTASLDAATVQAVDKGGTGIDSYTAGDLLYASGTTTLSKLPMGAAGQKLATNSGATAPEWVDETGDISGVSITAGTGLTGTVTTTTGDHTQTLDVDSTFVATTSASGLMSGADKTKLDAIEAGATAEVAATTTTAGIVELATNAETTTGTDTVRAVTPAGVQAAVDSILDGAPAALDTLNELADAINDDASYASTITTALALKAPIASPTFTGTVAIPNIANLETAVAANTLKVSDVNHNVTTNLDVVANGTSLTVTSSDGIDASIPAVTISAWGAMTDEDKTKLDGIEAGADVTDATNVNSAGAVMESDFDATTFLYATSDNTPQAKTPSEVRAILNVADGANAYSHPNHTGDVASTGDGTTTIGDDKVTYAKIQNVTATDRILGRDSAGAGIVEEITPANLRTMINVADGANAYSHPNHTGDVESTGDGATTIADNAVSLAKMAGLTRGSVIIGDSSGDPAALAIGNDTYVLTSDGDDISWAAGGGGGGGSGHAIKDEGGSALSTRNNLDFVGELVTATDNSGDDSTDITIDAKTAWLYG